ncbi:MAG: hypothetical protein ACT4PV_10995 [Planctomycetaceae bacterium]
MRARVILALLLFATAAAAAEGDSLADLLPSSTPLLLELRAPSVAEAENLASYRCMRDPALKAALKAMLGDENSFSSMAFPLGGTARLMLQTDLSNPADYVHLRYLDSAGERRLTLRSYIAAALVGFGGAEAPVDAVVALKTAEGAEESIETLKRLLAAASLSLSGETMGDVDAAIGRLFTRVEIQGVAVTRASLGPIVVFLAPVRGLVVIATSEERVKDLLARAARGSTDSLAADARHKEACAFEGAGTLTFTFAFHVDRFLTALEALKGPVAAQIRMGLQVVGLDSLGSLVSLTRVEGSGFRSVTSLLFQGERRGLAELFASGAPARLGGLAFAPSTTLYVTSGRFDPGAIWKIMGGVAGPNLARTEQAFRERFGLDLGADLLEQLGPEGTLIVATNHGLLPDIGIVLDVRDPAKVERALSAMLQKLPWPEETGVRKVRLAGVDAHVIPLGHPKLAGIPLAPTFGIYEGRLVLAPFPFTFQRLIATARGERPSLAQNAEFQRLRRMVPEEVLGISYLDVARLFTLYYDTFMPIAQSLSGAGGTTSIYDLPDAEIFARYFYGRIGWRASDARGMHWHCHNSLDLSPGLVVGAVAAGMAFLSMAKPERTLPRAGEEEGGERRDEEAWTCRTRVLRLKTRILMYRSKHGKLPDSLAELRAGHVDPETFLVPGAEGEYTYLGPAGQGRVLLHGKPNGRDRRICVLTTDLELLRVSPAQLAALKKP